MQSAEMWTARLASLLAEGMDAASTASALRELSDSHATGVTEIDRTRQSILHMLEQHARQKVAAVPVAIPAALPGGISLVAVDHPSAPLTTEAVRDWLRGHAAELVLVDAHCTPPLAQRLRSAGLRDARLSVLRLDQPGVTWAQAANIGVAAARHDRIWALSPTIRLAATQADLQDLPPGGFACLTGQVDGSGFFLDAQRGDLADAGGFHEVLPSHHGAVQILSQRLMAAGLHSHPVQAELLVPPPVVPTPMFAPPVPMASGTLLDSLLAEPHFPTKFNQHLAAALPAPEVAPCQFGRQDDLGQHITPPPPRIIPAAIEAQARQEALAEMMRNRLGGTPQDLPPDRLARVLARPALDVSAIDVAVAATPFADLVSTRTVWLVLDLGNGPLPTPGSPAARTLTKLTQLAVEHRQTPVLRCDAVDPGFTTCPVIRQKAGFWPIELRELGRTLGDRAPRHATMPFDQQLIDDVGHLILSGPAVLNRRPKVFIDAQHGLGNRMRAIASAGAVALGMDRELVIIWQQDDHCACAYEDLFYPYGAVLNQGFIAEAEAMGMTLYNYMEIEPGAAKDAPIDLGAYNDIYIRSAFPLVSPCANWHTENAWIRNLAPNDVVRDLVASVRNPNDLSIHIRMEGGADAEHLPYESAKNWTAEAHQEIGRWRKRSHYSFFLPRLDALIAEGLAESVFIAADTPAAYDAFADRYGKRVTWLPRKTSDRTAQSIVYALADALLLGRAPRLLGSSWSSFSELAARLSPAPMTVELSGRDF